MPAEPQTLPAAGPAGPADRLEFDQPSPLVLSRRALLRSGGLTVGGIGAATLLAACAPAGRPAWTYAPASPAGSSAPGSSPGATASAPAATGSAVPSAAASTAPIPTGNPAATASAAAASASPSASQGAARDPSPADFAVPPPYRARLSSPVEFTLTARDGDGQAILIDADHVYNSMNFNSQVPAPTLRLTEGDTVHFTLTNEGSLSHSIDFHAAQTPWSKNYQEVKPGTSFSFDWTAEHAGVFMYHCGTPPVLMHIGDGMYGAVIVDPKDGRPTAREYVVVQSEFYGAGGDYNAMLGNPPDVVCFNGQAFRYKATPLTASAGELVRLFVMNAGPNNTSAFHVIGELFDAYEPEGYPANRMGMHQTIVVPPGDGAMVELVFDAPGTYPFVTHKFNDAERGAVGLIAVS
jgi:nitrite reductase (NO-forming)